MIKQVILIEDDDAMRLSLTQTLDLEKITVIAANSLMQAKRNNRANFSGVIISDIRMPTNDGFDVLAYVKSVDNELPTIMLTGEADVPMALQAIKSGAYDFLEKPFNSDKLIILSNRAIENSRLKNENQDLKELIAPDVSLIGKSHFISNTKKSILNYSKSNSRLLIEGQFGVGKSLIANQIHQYSKYKDKIPLKIDFASLNEGNLDDLFSDDLKNLSDNLFIRSNHNTLILSNVDQIPLKFQKQFLFFIENPEFFKSSNIELDHKIITISEKNLDEEVKNGNVLIRLYERLKVDHMICPSLSNRIPDIQPILNYYISKFNTRNINLSFSKSAISKLEMFNWPGNIAQLVNYVEKTVILNQSSTKDLILDVDSLALDMGDYKNEEISSNNYDLSLKEARIEFEKEYLLSQIKRFSGNITKVSEFTGMERTALYRKLKSLNISVN